MKVVLSTTGRFHLYDLARQLHARGLLEALYTAYPRFKLTRERLPQSLVHTYPWVHAPMMALSRRRWLTGKLRRDWEYIDRVLLDRHVSRRLPDCDVFVGLSSASLFTARIAASRGIKYVCECASSHIRFQDTLLREEYERWGIPFAGVDGRLIDRQEEEYGAADRISVPSRFAQRSFEHMGVPASTLRCLPFGVDVADDAPVERPSLGRFDVLFAGALTLRKGLPYALEAFSRLSHPSKSLTLIGAVEVGLIEALKRRLRWPEHVRILSPVPLAQLKVLMSRSHVTILPSVEDGFGLVLAHAIACGCPVIGSENTGIHEVLSAQGREGYAVPIRDSEALAVKLQRLADEPALRDAMSQAARERVAFLGGWNRYGDSVSRMLQELTGGGAEAMRH